MITIIILFIVSLLLLPMLFIGMGKMLLKVPPYHPNNLYGYRTRRSSLSQESWIYAQEYSGKYLFFLGRILLILSILVALIGSFYLSAIELKI